MITTGIRGPMVGSILVNKVTASIRKFKKEPNRVPRCTEQELQDLATLLYAEYLLVTKLAQTDRECSRAQWTGIVRYEMWGFVVEPKKCLNRMKQQMGALVQKCNIDNPDEDGDTIMSDVDMERELLFEYLSKYGLLFVESLESWCEGSGLVEQLGEQ